MATLPDGQYLANMPMSMDLLIEYVELAEKGDLDTLYRKIEAHTQDSSRHPNQIIFGVSMLLGAMRKGTGRSFIPVIKAGRNRWAKGSDALSPSIYNG